MNIKRFVFGYVRLKTKSSDINRCLSLILKLNLNADVKDNEFILSVSEYKSFSRFAKGLDIISSEVCGLPGFLYSLLHSPGILVGVGLSFAIALLLYIPVWDVRVDGDIGISKDEAVTILADSGLYVGRPWKLVDLDEIESAVLGNNDKISWVNINRSGNVAYVKMILNEKKQSTTEDALIGSIVASKDSVVEEIDVKSGLAAVNPGDVVKEGDVLILGVVDTEFGTSFPGASGIVRGSVSESLRVFVPRIQEKESETERFTVDKKLKIFNFTLNLFKKYGNRTDGCDIITEKRSLNLFGGIELPISIIETVAVRTERYEVTLSDSELISLAAEKIQDEIETLTRDNDLIKLGTKVNIDEGGYEAYLDVVYLTEIGVRMPLEIDTEELWQKK